ncbi:DUF4112 domain-containing protein [Primorskyibacter sp. S187A]|uniref:DUF4112 domain-containing protein n=1 Tax=Primorskyibacter sp. S187A TaxID=3415130 RepID=UPI003C7AF751
MPSTSLPAADLRHGRLDRLERMANQLDSRFRFPGTNIRFGWDSVLGLVPGLGDIVTAGPAAWLILEGWRMGARKRALARMGLNAALDFTIGGIPVLGDLFDVAFKANRRNLALLKADLSQNAPAPRDAFFA